MSADGFTLGPLHEWLGGWCRPVQIGPVTYTVGVERGRRVRIAFKPRGQNLGFRWHGFVRHDGKRVWEGQVGKSAGARGMLRAAGLLPDHRCTGRRVCRHCSRQRDAAAAVAAGCRALTGNP